MILRILLNLCLLSKASLKPRASRRAGRLSEPRWFTGVEIRTLGFFYYIRYLNFNPVLRIYLHGTSPL